ncbi:MAG: IPExxxVDY family protein, partial [Bacteroidales bacterium]|nr:IPExxxVDY family protein [Bacteroidales bacterium]
MGNNKRRHRLHTADPRPMTLFGLVTDESDFKLTWLLNQHLHTGLVRKDDWAITLKNQPATQYFPVFEGELPLQQGILLVQNRSTAGAWLTPYHQVNFLLVLSGQLPSSSVDRWLTR